MSSVLFDAFLQDSVIVFDFHLFSLFKIVISGHEQVVESVIMKTPSVPGKFTCGLIGLSPVGFLNNS